MPCSPISPGHALITYPRKANTVILISIHCEIQQEKYRIKHKVTRGLLVCITVPVKEEAIYCTYLSSFQWSMCQNVVNLLLSSWCMYSTFLGILNMMLPHTPCFFSSKKKKTDIISSLSSTIHFKKYQSALFLHFSCPKLRQPSSRLSFWACAALWKRGKCKHKRTGRTLDQKKWLITKSSCLLGGDSWKK